MRLLEQYRFEYRDQGLKPEESDEGRLAIRRRLLSLVDQLADAQNDRAERALILTVGRPLINSIAYEPPRIYAYGTFGTALELGASVYPLDSLPRWLRFNLALRSTGILTIAKGFRFAAMAGPEAHLLFMTTPVLQPMLGVRGGYQAGSGDDLSTDACREADARQCSHPLVEGYFALAILERIRAQATLEYALGEDSFEDGRLDLQVGLGVQFF